MGDYSTLLYTVSFTEMSSSLAWSSVLVQVVYTEPFFVSSVCWTAILRYLSQIVHTLFSVYVFCTVCRNCWGMRSEDPRTLVIDTRTSYDVVLAVVLF